MDFSPKTPKGFMALVFCSMALPCLTHPDLILRLCVKPDALPETKRGKDLARVLMVCFGSQAMLSGIAISIGTWDRKACAIWAGAIVPFFALDYLGWSSGTVTPLGAIGDALGNVVFITCSALAGGFFSGAKGKKV